MHYSVLNRRKERPARALFLVYNYNMNQEQSRDYGVITERAMWAVAIIFTMSATEADPLLFVPAVGYAAGALVMRLSDSENREQ